MDAPIRLSCTLPAGALTVVDTKNETAVPLRQPQERGEASDPHGLTRLAETWPPCGLMYVMGLRPCEEHEHDYRQAMDHCIGRPGSVCKGNDQNNGEQSRKASSFTNPKPSRESRASPSCLPLRSPPTSCRAGSHQPQLAPARPSPLPDGTSREPADWPAPALSRRLAFNQPTNLPRSI
nr:unnamed protein product [Digitaria exilis]